MNIHSLLFLSDVWTKQEGEYFMKHSLEKYYEFRGESGVYLHFGKELDKKKFRYHLVDIEKGVFGIVELSKQTK